MGFNDGIILTYNQWIGLLGKILTGNPWVFTMKKIWGFYHEIYGFFTMKISPKPIHWYNQSWNNLNEFSGSTLLSLKESDENLNDNKNNHNDDKTNISNEIWWW